MKQDYEFEKPEKRIASPNYPAMQQKLQQAAREAITARGQMLKELDKGLRHE